jgi:hypothetical protein
MAKLRPLWQILDYSIFYLTPPSVHCAGPSRAFARHFRSHYSTYTTYLVCIERRDSGFFCGLPERLKLMIQFQASP